MYVASAQLEGLKLHPFLGAKQRVYGGGLLAGTYIMINNHPHGI